MWADPDISPVFKQGQAAQTRAIAENLRIPERARPENHNLISILPDH